ncbi:MAG: hypothetical protein AB7E55_14515 [Pigmentiphaga sp.]
MIRPPSAGRGFPPQRGQALVLGLFLLALASLAWIQLYQGGQLIHEKNRLVHATDAAAYSGAVVQARALNFLALANRAQVAHQVALAHLVTLDAWSAYGAHAAQRVAQGNPPAYLIGALFGPTHGAAYTAALGAGSEAAWRLALAEAIQAHDRLAHDVLWRAQLAVLESLPEVRGQVMQAVLQANFPAPGPAGEVRLDGRPLTDDLPGALAAGIGATATPLRDLVLQAVGDHPFLAPRHHETRNAWIVSSRCPGLRHILRRRGQTRLDADDGWWADDTQSYHALRSNRWIGCYYREYPMGWAETATAPDGKSSGLEHIETPPRDFAAEDFWRWVRRRTGWDLQTGTDNPLANSWAVADARRHHTRGFGGMVDFVDDRRSSSLRFAIRAFRPRAALAVAGGTSQVRMAPRWMPVWALPGEQLAAIAAAETVFVAALPGEAPSLFTPGWHARLVPVRDEEREEARHRQEPRI